jgi:hypothetical protein
LFVVSALLLILLAACSPAAPQDGELNPTLPAAPAPTPVPPAATEQPAQPLPLPVGQLVVDNADPSFAVPAGSWGECWGGDCDGTPYGDSFRFAGPGCADCQALFAFPVTAAGPYDVWAWWPAGEDRATDTPFTIHYGDQAMGVEVDQRNNGDSWFLLATLEFPAGPARIVVGGADSGYANADAVALTPAGAGAPGAYGGTGMYSGAVTPGPTADQAEPPTPAPVVPPPEPGGTLVVDYRMSDISRIPDEWIARARQVTVHYAHTSHGSQIVTGLEWLAAQDPRYAAAVRSCAGDLGLPDDTGALRICDGNPPDDYVTPDLYWSTEDGLNRTRAAAATGLFNFSAWAWCGEQSENDTATVQQYLDTLDQLEREYPTMRFIYWTGHTDGGSEALARNNDTVRAYVDTHGKVLFDFASFEMYDPAGNYYPDASDACVWCEAWCNDHPDDCRNLDQMGDCAHTHPLQCKLKAQAFWWLMAELAGWDGQP